MTLESLGRLVVEKRGSLGIRAAAAEVGVSPATLSRVENGHLPDLERFRKICKWLGIEAESVLGTTFQQPNADVPRAHFKKNATINQETAQALAQLILAAQRAIAIQEGEQR